MTERKLQMVIEGILFDWIISVNPISNIAICKKIFDTLEQAGYVLLDEDQSLPLSGPYSLREAELVRQARDAMLAANFKKIRRE